MLGLLAVVSLADDFLRSWTAVVEASVRTGRIRIAGAEVED